MKKRLVLILALLMVVMAVGCGAGEPQASEPSATGEATGFDSLEPVKLIGADNSGVGAVAQLYGELVSAKVNEITGGKLTVDYFPNSQLGNDQELQAQMLAGDIDFVVAQTAQTVSFVPEVAIFDLPMVFAKYDAATIDYALNNSEFYTKINEAYKAKNMQVLHYLQGATFRETTSNKKIETIEDFRGLKIRTMENQNHMAFWRALGASPTPLPWPEVYVSLQQGLVDAQENATDTNVGANLHEVQDYLLMTHHILYCNQFLINSEKFESLDPLYKEALMQAVKEAAAEIEGDLARVNEENKDILVSGGMELVEFDESFIDEVVSISQGVYDSIGSSIGQDYVDALLNALENAN
ncbi:tripartite ATP-independent transporter DctP family solute receptor [Acetoanaerobium pronyense]|uniref:Tripartite ATP-independent transporter DctP family solute receptor n=1 Tax=Acetoanaerobium pronyense TaxID=1482736 RepID=A0ABS4KFG2_9FIRM|nr:TRAP transporter substrate-binding protein [Acetoanaerobium pronyense]MBP2026499.1 tripartite ATP-independent transporter DctP family solute receptor [Acetoanaerobium pronyense]